MSILTVLLGIIKYSFFILVGAFILGRIFFPDTLENSVITPIRQFPVVGQVLGATWDTSGKVGPELTRRTIRLADQVEKSDMPISDTVSNLANSENPGQEATQLVERKLNESVSSLQNVPAEVLEQAKAEIRKEMYQQICNQWLGSPTPSPSPASE